VPPNVQCDASSIGRTACQLYVGHEGTHSALVLHNGQRVLRRWPTGRRPIDTPFAAAAAAGLAWAPGCPQLVSEPTKTQLHVIANDGDASDGAARTPGRRIA
jgi:hypothetical protein